MQDLLQLQTLEFGETQNDNIASMIAALRGKIPPQILGHYDRFSVRGKKGLAVVNNQVCSGCHMRLPLAVIMTLKHGHDLQLCDSCGRYLYLPDELAGAPARESLDAKPAPAPRRRKKTVPAIDPVAMGGGLTTATTPRPRINPG